MKISLIIVASLVVISLVVFFTTIKPAIEFNNTFSLAKKQIQSGDLWDALKTLETINDHAEVSHFISSSSELQGELTRIAAYNKGNVILLGEYEQDGVESDGKEPIEWVVLGEEDEKRVLVSKLVLDYQYYNTEEIRSKRFEGSYLEYWLNNDFLTSAFLPEERSHISQVSLLENSASIYSKTNTYNIVDVRIILGTNAAKASEYASSLGSDGSYALKNVLFSLSKSSNYRAYEVTAYGSETEYGVSLAEATVANGKYYYEKTGVRPVIWIDISHLQ